MSLLLKALALKLLAGRTIGGVFGLSLMVLAPLAGILKFIGLPLLIVLALVGAPIFLLLSVIGLPVLWVLGIGGVLMLMVGALLAIGVVAIKIALPIILIVWFVRWVRRPKATQPPAVPDAGLEGR